MDADRRVILFSGGGSAGHLAPGFALADALEARGVAVAFATPGEAVERAWFEGRVAPWMLPAQRLPRGPGALLRFPFRFRRAVRAARQLFEARGVGCLVALGGWPSAPAAWAARGAGVPLIFLVPDAVPGVVVRKLARRAQRIYLADERAATHLPGHPGLQVSGPLLRRQALDLRRDAAAFDLDPALRTLFVTGGSLGAEGLYERFLAGLEAALEGDPGLRQRLQILHSVGRAGGGAAERYARLGLRHHVTDYVHDMGAAYGTADLVLCRAGANTCAEIAATRTPAVFVPYPHHPDRQQFLNAAPWVEAGAARLIEQEYLTPQAVRVEVLDLVLEVRATDAMRAAFPPAPPSAATETAVDLVRFLEWSP